MDNGHWPFILIELVLVFGAVLGFAVWQLRDLNAEKRRREAREAQDTRETHETHEAHEEREGRSK